MKTYKELNEKIDRQYTSDYTLSKSGRKVHRTPLVDKDAEKVNESDTKQEHDLGYAHASQGKKSNPYNPGSPAHSAYESGHETYKRHFGEETMTIDEQINEVLSKDATAGDWIHDFVHSDNPKFEGKSKDKRKQMALAAYYAKQQNEEVEPIEELETKTLKSYINKNIKSGRADDGGKGDTGLYTATNKVARKLATSTLDKKVNKLGNTSALAHKNPYEYDASRSELKNRGIHHFAGRRTRTEEVELEEGESHQAKTTMKHIPNASDKLKQAAKDIKPGIKGYLDRVAMLKAGNVKEQAPVAPVPDKKYIKGTPEHKAYKATKKPINGMPTNVKEGTMKSFKEMLQSLDESNYDSSEEANSVASKLKAKYNDGNYHVTQQNGKHKVQHAYYSNTIVKKNIRKLAEEVEQIDEKSEQAKQNKMMKNMMDASRGARYKVQNKVSADDVRDWDGKHPTPRAQNVAIGRALRNEDKKEDPPFDGPYTKSPGNVKDKSGAVHTPMSRAKHLARQAMQKKMKEDIDLFFEAKDESEYGYEGDMAISQLKTICRHAEEFMGMLKPDTDLPEWVQSKITLATDYIQTAHDYMSSEMNEELKGNQHKLDKNKNGKVDSGDLKMLRGEECPECHKAPCECGHMKEETDVETRTLSFGDFMNQLNEYNPGPGGVTRVQGRSYGAQYRDPEGEDDADDKKKQVAKSEPAVKRGRGRPAGSKSGANQKVTTGRKGSGVDYTGYKLHLPNSNR